MCECRGEFNNASARRALVDWYLSLFIMGKAGHQYKRPRALALLNLPLVSPRKNSKIISILKPVIHSGDICFVLFSLKYPVVSFRTKNKTV